jgi:predicted AAA+ superfamily ATPase
MSAIMADGFTRRQRSASGICIQRYKHPTEFFRRTFLTQGLRDLLRTALRRIAGQGGDPVVELQTNFGGGKTHSMLALYHLFGGTPASELPGVEELVKETGVPVSKNVRRAVLVGTKIGPGQPHKKPDGTAVRTLWGELAWQLGGKEGYQLVKEADETATNPGDALTKLFNKYAPCLVLLDEWVAYARQLHDEPGRLPGGTFDTQFTFAQALTECAKAARGTLVVVSIPASEEDQAREAEEGRRQRPEVSDMEIGGVRGRQALARLKNAVGRVESSWRPANADEGFEIVRRRLFQPLSGDGFAARDAMARAFADMYAAQHNEFPPACREGDYERRIKLAYPIHPELFDRLYNDWSALEKFQRTRGVLRLMAAVIHALWERQDSNLLILPATVPVDDSGVQFELTRYMEDPWVPVIEKDVDGPHSLPLALDREHPTLGRYSACRRVARTLYLGSAPTQRAAHRGLEDQRVKLGCVQPGEAVATFGDALRRLTGRATYLYEDGKRYWYATTPTVTRLAEDRANQLKPHDVHDEILRWLRGEAKSRADFDKVHVGAGGGDVPDECEARLVILGPEHPHANKDAKSAARREAAAILDLRGSSPRTYRNTLVFLAADLTRLKELDQAVRLLLAWNSICNEKQTLNLDAFQARQADVQRKSAEDTVKARIPETYQWLLVPGQSDPRGDLEWTDLRLQGSDGLALRAAKRLRNEEMLVNQLGGSRLRHELDRVPLWRGDHVSIKQLAEDVARYLYLPRLRDSDVLLEAVRDGLNRLTWQAETCAFAEGWDEGRKCYVGLRAGEVVAVSADDGRALLVRPEAAAKQLAAQAERERQQGGDGKGATDPGGDGQGKQRGGDGDGKRPDPEPPKKLGRFHATANLDPLRVPRDAGQIAQEVIQHLTSLVGARVTVTLEIHAELPDGASDKLVRDVTENCRTLRFESYGFEEI